MLRHYASFLFGVLLGYPILARWHHWHPHNFMASQPPAASPVVPKGTHY